MKKFCAYIILLISFFNINAQETINNFNRSNSQKAVMYSSDIIATALPLTASVASLLQKDWTGFKQFALSSATAVGTSLILKYAIDKERPDFSNNNSFPSGHSAVAFSSAAFIHRRYGWKFGVPAFAVATYVGWARIYSKKHDIWDVLAGAAIGAGAAFIYTKPFAQKHQVQIVPASDGHNFSITATMTF